MRRLTLFAVFVLLAGCQPPTPTPKPPPEPQPPGQACNVVIVTDVDKETPEHAAVYCAAAVRSYLAKSGHELRVIDAAVVAEGKLPPGYLKPYLEAAKGKDPPVVVTGKAGKAIDVSPLPATGQGLIDLVEKTASGAPTADTLWAGGERRYLGCLPVRPQVAQRWQTEGDSKNEPLIPPGAWKDCDFEHLAAPTIDQNGYSSCCACASVQATGTGIVRSGLNPVELSVVDCYSRGNGGRDQGMTLEDGVSIAMQGVCSTQYAAMWGVTKTNHKPGFEIDRARHRILKATWCPSAEHVGSALQRHRPVVFGTMVGSGFEPDARGVIGPTRGANRGGHAMYLVGAKKIDGGWYFRVVNSWGTGWGQGGRAWIHESWIDARFGAWAVQSVASPSDEPLPAQPSVMLRPRAVFAQAL